MSRKALLLTFAALFVLLASARTAEACSCGGTGGPCESFGAASAVFVGTVAGARTREPKSVEAERAEPDWTPVVVRFTVLQPLLGVEGSEFEVATGRGGGDCGYGFRRGETYIVYAYGGGAGKPPVTGICTRTRPVAEASEDLERPRPSRSESSSQSSGE